MAEINMPQRSGKRKMQIPRIDFTPMVDLGFLLISFFMITTTLAKPKTMELNMPSNEHTPTPTVFVEESTVTLIPVKDHRVVYYYGALNDIGQLKETAIINIRGLLLKKKNEVANLPATLSADAHKLHVLIKPNSDCKYSDVVQLLDEMNIVSIPIYALVDVSPQEKEWIEK